MSILTTMHQCVMKSIRNVLFLAFALSVAISIPSGMMKVLISLPIIASNWICCREDDFPDNPF